jgi:hypothetical protein
MKKGDTMKQFSFAFFICLTSTLWAQNITIIEDETEEKTTVLVFEVDSQEQIPIYIPKGSMTLEEANSNIIINQYQELGSAPITFEIDNGYYIFQMYKGLDATTFKVYNEPKNQDNFQRGFKVIS